jgi:hypothetical protein
LLRPTHFPLQHDPPGPVIVSVTAQQVHAGFDVIIEWDSPMLTDPVDPSKWVLNVAGAIFSGGTYSWIDSTHLELVLHGSGFSPVPDDFSYLDSPSDVFSAQGGMFPATSHIPFTILD